MLIYVVQFYLLKYEGFFYLLIWSPQSVMKHWTTVCKCLYPVEIDLFYDHV